MQTLKHLSVSSVEKFVSENNGIAIDCADGVLLDNVVYAFDFGTLFCFEEYLNTWSSGYVCYFFHKNRDRGISKMWDRFNDLKADEEEIA